jgi:hypothetical protein
MGLFLFYFEGAKIQNPGFGRVLFTEKKYLCGVNQSEEFEYEGILNTSAGEEERWITVR